MLQWRLPNLQSTYNCTIPRDILWWRILWNGLNRNIYPHTHIFIYALADAMCTYIYIYMHWQMKCALNIHETQWKCVIIRLHVHRIMVNKISILRMKTHELWWLCNLSCTKCPEKLNRRKITVFWLWHLINGSPCLIIWK